MTDHADIVREFIQHAAEIHSGSDDALAALDALVAERDEAVTKLARAETELRYTHDRGDHLVYFHEWQEFDKWQRWADDQRKDAEKYQPTAQEFNDAMEGS